MTNPVEIIYCKDCKFAHITYGGEVKYCDVWSPDEKIYMEADENFCSMAERKGNEMGGSNVPKQPNVPPMPEEEVKPITYQDCANAMMMMWIDNVLTDGEYNRIMDKLNAHELEEREKRGELK